MQVIDYEHFSADDEKDLEANIPTTPTQLNVASMNENRDESSAEE